MAVFSPEVQQRCGVPDVEEIPPLPELVGCSVGRIPIPPRHDFYPPISGPPGCNGLNGVDGMDAPGGIDGFGKDGCKGINGVDGMDAPMGIDGFGKDGDPGPPGADGMDAPGGIDGFGKDGDPGPPGADAMDAPMGIDGRAGCNGINGTDAMDAPMPIDGRMGCRGLDGVDGQDAPAGMDGSIPYDRFIWDGCLAFAAGDGASVIRVRPNCDTSYEIIDVEVPYPDDFKAVAAGWPVRYYEARSGRYILLDMPCPGD